MSRTAAPGVSDLKNHESPATGQYKIDICRGNAPIKTYRRYFIMSKIKNYVMSIIREYGQIVEMNGRTWHI